MKYLLSLLLLLSVVFLGACNSGKSSTGDSSDRPDVTIYKMEYEGHSYLVVTFNNTLNRAGFTHDENCKCRKKY